MFAVRVADADQQVDRQIGDEGEGVGRVHALGGEQRVDLVEKVALGEQLLRQAQVGVGDNADLAPGQKPLEFHFQFLLFPEQVAYHQGAVIDLFLGQAAIHRQFLDPGPDLLLEAADPFHKKLVKVGTDHRQKKDPFQQGDAIVLPLMQHPPIEGQPGQFAVKIPLGVCKIIGGRLWCCSRSWEVP